eukprot:jgi/Undpi1/9751/HiC_scaffold_27.g12207.m1
MCPTHYVTPCQAALASFYIELDYSGTWTDARQAVFQSAADRWSEVITNVPCGGATNYPAGRLLITATLEEIDGEYGTLGSAGPTSIWTACPTISAVGVMRFDIADIAWMETEGLFEGVIQHEMGHVIGIGTLWGDCSTCRTDGDSNWKCPAAVAVYNDLLGDPAGSDADIIELDGGSGTACGHFDESIFEDELMTGYVNRDGMPLSKMTAALLDDTNYIVDPSMVDAYTLPSRRENSIVTEPAPDAFVLGDIAVDTMIDLIDEDGEVSGQMVGINMQF